MWKYLMFILGSDDLKFIDLCVQGITEITSLNTTLIRLTKSDDISQLTALKQVILKCFKLTDNWTEFIKHNESPFDIKNKYLESE